MLISSLAIRVGTWPCTERLCRVPAVSLGEGVADPTGAGNAYAGALCAQLAAGAQPAEAAAAVASAVGAALCRTADWAPPDAAEAREWVRAAARELVCGEAPGAG